MIWNANTTCADNIAQRTAALSFPGPVLKVECVIPIFLYLQLARSLPTVSFDFSIPKVKTLGREAREKSLAGAQM